jgi:NAD(P)-dependent dehydrogenase (short-subunit alcohol dehydrogenase family)
MAGRLVDQRVAVVGGSSGIGLAVARAACAEGAAVTIAGRDAERLEDAAGALGAVENAAVDARDPAAVERFFAAAGPFDHVVCTIHSTSDDTLGGVLAPLADMDLEAARDFADGKWWAQLQLARAAPRAIHPGGSLTLTSGAASTAALDDHALIGPVNCAIEGLVPKIAKELAPIRVNAVSPGLVKTPAYDRLPGPAREAMYAAFAARLPVGWVAAPADIAKAYVFVMEATYVTGAVIGIDGGVHLANSNQGRADV